MYSDPESIELRIKPVTRRTGNYMIFRIIILLLASLTGCSTVTVTDYQKYTPQIELNEFFVGSLTAHGLAKNRAGKVVRMFNANIEAQWSKGVGTLIEDFIFDDGEQQQRIWTLTPTGDGDYIGTAGDVIGTGTLESAGNSIFLDYVLRVPYREDTIDVKVDDRMYLIAPDVLINESIMTKYGVRVGSLSLVIIRQPNTSP
jgi:hypothetical protein